MLDTIDEDFVVNMLEPVLEITVELADGEGLLEVLLKVEEKPLELVVLPSVTLVVPAVQSRTLRQ